MKTSEHPQWASLLEFLLELLYRATVLEQMYHANRLNRPRKVKYHKECLENKPDREDTQPMTQLDKDCYKFLTHERNQLHRRMNRFLSKACRENILYRLGILHLVPLDKDLYIHLPHHTNPSHKKMSRHYCMAYSHSMLHQLGIPLHLQWDRADSTL